MKNPSGNTNLKKMYHATPNDLRNVNYIPEDQAHLYFPEIGTRFDRKTMISTVEVLNGDVVEVLMPGIAPLGKNPPKALVVVRT